MSSVQSPASTAATADLIDLPTLMQIKSLELRARHVVEGFWSGLNRSPYHGFSVEFTEYRQYSPGDDPRYLDWRLYARSDRYYIKRFEDETNLRCQLLLDVSRSMAFGSLDYDKAEYARTLAATLAYFLAMQRDAVGLATFDEQIDEFIPARYRSGHLRRLLVTLERAVSGPVTDLARPLEQLAERLGKRGMLVLMSDLLAPVDRFETSLGYLAARGHEVLLFHVLDPAELTFDFEQPALFEDVESGRQLYIDPLSARQQYLDRLEAHLAQIRTSCDRLGISYHRMATDTPLEDALGDLLRLRMRGYGRTQRQHARRMGRPA